MVLLKESLCKDSVFTSRKHRFLSCRTTLGNLCFSWPSRSFVSTAGMKRCCIRAITLLAEEKLYSPVSDRFILWFLGSNITLTLLTEPSCVREGESKELSALSTSPCTMLKCDLMLSLLVQRHVGDSSVCFYIRMKKKQSGKNYFQPRNLNFI